MPLARALHLAALSALLVTCRPTVDNPHGFCHGDDECPAGQHCFERACTGAARGCERCRGATPICKEGRCLCQGYGDTDSCEGGLVCVAGACVECTDSMSCGKDACCARATGRCVRPEWTELQPQGEAPTARYNHAALYDPDGQRMLMFGGRTAVNQYLGDLWELDLGETPVWTPYELPKAPSPRSSVAVDVDRAGKRALFVGGYLEDGRAAVDIEVLALTKIPSWSTLVLPDPPPVRTAATLTYDPERARMLLFGGYQEFVGQWSDVWALTLGTPAWIPLAPSGGPPTPRGQHTALFDGKRDTLVVYGGIGSRTLGDAWALDAAADPPVWTPVTTEGTPPIAEEGHSAVFEPESRRMVVFGGYHYGTDQVHVDTVRVLALDAGSASGAWTELHPLGTPPAARDRHSAIFDEKNQRMVVYGGKTGPRSETLLPDVWALSLPACY